MRFRYVISQVSHDHPRSPATQQPVCTPFIIFIQSFLFTLLFTFLHFHFLFCLPSSLYYSIRPSLDFVEKDTYRRCDPLNRQASPSFDRAQKSPRPGARTTSSRPSSFHLLTSGRGPSRACKGEYPSSRQRNPSPSAASAPAAPPSSSRRSACRPSSPRPTPSCSRSFRSCS